MSKTFLGHPRGLATLFFTEMFERFSFYGMRALLILFMTKSIAEGGLAFDDKTSGAIYGLYVMGVYILALPGGWLADRLFGLKKAVWYGGIIIAIGHFTMAIPGLLELVGVGSEEVTQLDTVPFFLGLILICVGTGLLKPNVSSMVGSLYVNDTGARRDAGFSIFYSGINLGALVAPLVTSPLGEFVNWHLGFAAAGLFMVFGLIQYKTTEKYLDGIGDVPSIETPEEVAGQTNLVKWLRIIVIGIIILLTMAFMGVIPIDAIILADFSGVLIVFVAFLFLGYVLFLGGLEGDEKKKVIAIGIVFIFSAMFWSGFEQAGSTLNIFADRFTDRNIFGMEIAAGIFQSINPLFLVLFAPVFASMWIWLAKRNLEPSSPVKFAFGLILLGVGFLIMVFAAKVAVSGELAAPGWLLLTYMFHTFGELSLSPVGLSLTTKLAPKKFYSQMMGIWFMSVSLGNLIAGRLGGEISGDGEGALDKMPDQFMLIVITTVASGVLLLLLYKPIRSLMGDVK
ncbi:peptide MFS transporter [Fulvivirga sediminis]|uniref:Peptide MFS transporter n=1 Tax=Fulvivirga sediminis TaxID=2803949 RepID=A0A937JYH1_9BACT|nr:peptide MFS transporter [Fulvivirga sediminis]MBL3655674.1 peptide MFS transporter [Fulvivirga sediminis]